MSIVPDAMLAHLIRPTGCSSLLMLLCFVPDAGCDAGASYPAYGLFDNSLMLLDFVGRIRRFRRIRQPVFTR
ncbi:hypothetical protein ACLB1S_26520 [Escherichia coli]